MAYPKEAYHSSSLWEGTRHALKHAAIHVGVEAGIATAHDVKEQYATNLEQIQGQTPAPEALSPLRLEGVAQTEGKLAVVRANLAHERARLTHAVSVRVEAVKQINKTDALKAGAEAVRDAAKKQILPVAKAGLEDIRKGNNKTTTSPLA